MYRSVTRVRFSTKVLTMNMQIHNQHHTLISVLTDLYSCIRPSAGYVISPFEFTFALLCPNREKIPLTKCRIRSRERETLSYTFTERDRACSTSHPLGVPRATDFTARYEEGKRGTNESDSLCRARREGIYVRATEFLFHLKESV